MGFILFLFVGWSRLVVQEVCIQLFCVEFYDDWDQRVQIVLEGK